MKAKFVKTIKKMELDDSYQKMVPFMKENGTMEK